NERRRSEISSFVIRHSSFGFSDFRMELPYASCYRIPMNMFSTEHPLAAQPSWFDAKVFPVRSWLLSAAVLAAIGAPILLAVAIYSDLSQAFQFDTPGPIPQSVDDWLGAISGSFIVCLAGALMLIAVLRVIRRHT